MLQGGLWGRVTLFCDEAARSDWDDGPASPVFLGNLEVAGCAGTHPYQPEIAQRDQTAAERVARTFFKLVFPDGRATERRLPNLLLDELRIVPVGTVVDALKSAFGD